MKEITIKLVVETDDDVEVEHIRCITEGFGVTVDAAWTPSDRPLPHLTLRAHSVTVKERV